MEFDLGSVSPQAQLLSRIGAWAAARDDVLGLVLTGSFGQQGARTDELSDIDIEVIVEDVDPLMRDDSWWRGLGDVWTAQIVAPYAAAPTQRYPMLHVSYAGAIRVDFTLVDRVRIVEMVDDGALDRVYEQGYRVLADREGLTRRLPAATGVRPDAVPVPAREFQEAIEAFWFEAPLVAKYLVRGELWEAKVRDQTMKALLLRMLEWHAAALRGYRASGYHRGRRLRAWVDARTWQEVQQVYGRLDAEDAWRALDATTGLFSRLGGETAQALRLDYPTQLDHLVRTHIAGLTRPTR